MRIEKLLNDLGETFENAPVDEGGSPGYRLCLREEATGTEREFRILRARSLDDVNIVLMALIPVESGALLVPPEARPATDPTGRVLRRYCLKE